MGDATRRCAMGDHEVPLDGFAKGQTICRLCRRKYRHNNYRTGNRCCECGTLIVDKAKRCSPCHGKFRRGKPFGDGRNKTVQGYIILSGQYDHPNADHRGLVLEHTKVMSEMIGRPLRNGENVHHKNGVRDDNRPENLELWTSSQPPGQRVSDLVAWAVEILETYGATHHEPEMAQHRRGA